jgi:hypothetical protein
MLEEEGKTIPVSAPNTLTPQPQQPQQRWSARSINDCLAVAEEDSTQPSSILLERMINSCWGIPITTYLQFVASPNCVYE